MERTSEEARRDQQKEEPEYQTSPQAPYNRKSVRQLGQPEPDAAAGSDEAIEREKQYYHGGKSSSH